MGGGHSSWHVCQKYNRCSCARISDAKKGYQFAYTLMCVAFLVVLPLYVIPHSNASFLILMCVFALLFPGPVVLWKITQNTRKSFRDLFKCMPMGLVQSGHLVFDITCSWLWFIKDKTDPMFFPSVPNIKYGGFWFGGVIPILQAGRLVMSSSHHQWWV